ncbi:MAG TPA: SufD family Fe-S cluster assembly protein [Patescibacteria group bacterium]|nr:SufD family Fe-S cluster assembly protein [Patescibacteria group bacterium]
METLFGVTRDLFEKSLSSSLPAERREYEQSFSLYEKSPLPTLKEEKWKYTDPSLLDVSLNIAPLTKRVVHFWMVTPEGTLKKIPSYSFQFSFPHKGQPSADTKFSSLFSAMPHEKHIIVVPKGVKVKKPVDLRIPSKDQFAYFVETFLLVEEGAEVIVKEIFLESSRPSFVGRNCFLCIEEGAHVTFLSLQSPGITRTLSFYTVILKKDGVMTSWFGQFGTPFSRIRNDVYLAGQGSEAHVYGTHMGWDSSHNDFLVLLDHQVGHTMADTLMHGVNTDAARSVFHGMIKIEKGASQANSYLSDHSLLLSDAAKADSIPSLEIESHDVRASHGATVGQIDEQQIFYAMTRGLSRDEAQHLIVEGFFDTVISLLPECGIREEVSRIVSAQMRAKHEEKAST